MYKLRAHRGDQGLRTPFPLMYFFTPKEAPEFRKAFETFIGFPARHAQSIKWDELRVHQVDGKTLPETKTVLDIIPDLLDPRLKWSVAIPILAVSQWGKLFTPNDADVAGLQAQNAELEDADARTCAKFLVSRSWGNYKATRGQPQPRPAYPMTAYLVDRDGVHAPLCNACPRVLLHEAGQCQIGDNICFAHLQNFAADNTFYKKLSKYQDLEGDEDDGVQKGNAGQPQDPEDTGTPEPPQAD